jgi:SPP1 gp7 family putative phage head morphogenesis protein
MNEAFPSLLDADGNRKPFDQFLQEVRTIDERYNKHWLRAEYNFAAASAQMAAKWEQFAADGDRYHLQYRTMKDDKVRPAHAELDGVTRPQSDPFWETFYPPNGYNCRCTVVQVRPSRYPATEPEEAEARGNAALERDPKGMFRFNPGIEKQVWPDYNPYTIRRCKDCDVASKLARPQDFELCEGCRVLRTIRGAKLEEGRKKYEEYLNNPDYKDVEFNEALGSIKASHIEHNFDKVGGKYETMAQAAGFNAGHNVILEKEVHNIHKQKQTEGTWDNEPFEIAGAETAVASNIRNALKHCASKRTTEIAVLVFPKAPFDKDSFLKGYKKFKGLESKNDGQYKLFKLIYCIQDGKIIYIKKPS